MPFCPSCVSRLPWWRRIDGCARCGWFSPIRATTCPGCYSGGSALDHCTALLRYSGSIRASIPHFKHHSTLFGPPLGSRLIVDFLTNELAQSLHRRIAAGEIPKPDWILPVPLHSLRLRRRGFNHSERIAGRIAARLDLPASILALRRVRDTPAQAFLDADGRRANMRGAFTARGDLVRGARVWLVDDVLTTGATLDAAAESLLDGGAEEVHAMTLAATPPRSRGTRSQGRRIADAPTILRAGRARQAESTAD